jgi:hypothetical protein
MGTVIDLPTMTISTVINSGTALSGPPCSSHISTSRLKGSLSAKPPSRFTCPERPCKLGSHGMRPSIAVRMWLSFFKAVQAWPFSTGSC